MDLSPAQRMKLLEFVCTFAWTDLKIQQEERDLVMRIAGRLELTADQVLQVERWLEEPPPIDEIDPTMIPPAHRELFLEVAELAIKADGKIAPAERDQLEVFRALLQ